MNWFFRHWKLLTFLLGVPAAIATIVGLVFSYQQREIAILQREENLGPKNVICNFKPYISKKTVLILGNIKNNEQIHANNLKVKGRYDGKAIKMNCIPSVDNIMKSQCKPEIYIELDKLSGGQSCDVHLAVKNDFSLTNGLFVSWGNGRSQTVQLTDPTADEIKAMNNLQSANKLLNNNLGVWFQSNQPTLKR